MLKLRQEKWIGRTLQALLCASLAVQLYYYSFLYTDMDYRSKSVDRLKSLNVRGITVYVNDFDYILFWGSFISATLIFLIGVIALIAGGRK